MRTHRALPKIVIALVAALFLASCTLATRRGAEPVGLTPFEPDPAADTGGAPEDLVTPTEPEIDVFGTQTAEAPGAEQDAGAVDEGEPVEDGGEAEGDADTGAADTAEDGGETEGDGAADDGADAGADDGTGAADGGEPADPTAAATPETEATVTPTPESRPAECFYTVQSGDNLYRIALRFGVTVNELAAANGIANPDSIDIGTELSIPTPECGTVTPGGTGNGQTYTVQPGDNLFRIAQRFGVTVNELAAANGITNPDSIDVGQVLTIPGAGGGESTGPADD